MDKNSSEPIITSDPFTQQNDNSSSFKDPILNNLELTENTDNEISGSLEFDYQSVKPIEIRDKTSKSTKDKSDSLTGSIPAVSIDQEALSLDSFVDKARKEIDKFAQRPKFINQMRDVFGDDWSKSEAKAIIQDITEGKELPEINIVPDLQDGHSAFGNDTIFIEQDYLEMREYSPEDFTNSLTEELGHYIDAQLNDIDSPGDEGYLFSTLTRNETLDPRELETIKQEDDSITISLDGEEISVELAEFSSIRPEYDSLTEKIVYKRDLEDIIDRNGLTTGVEKNKKKSWLIFEDLALRGLVSGRRIDKYLGDSFKSPRREKKTNGEYKGVVPDGVQDLEFRNIIGLGGSFKDSVFVEAKFYHPKGIYLDSPRSPKFPNTPGSWQITGHLDALRRTQAGELDTNAAVPALFLATPAGVNISTDLVRQASRDGVGLFHSILTTPIGNDNGVKFRMSESAILNPGVYDRKGLTPLDYGPGEYKELRSQTEIEDS